MPGSGLQLVERGERHDVAGEFGQLRVVAHEHISLKRRDRQVLERPDAVGAQTLRSTVGPTRA